MKTNNTKVFFRYEKEEVQTPEGVKLVTKPEGKIEAVAIRLEDGAELARREVKPRHGDLPEKALGRKYAFKKLMDFVLERRIIPGKEVEVLWKEFGTTCKQPSVKLAY